MQSAGTRALSQAMEETAIEVGELGAEEVAEGLTRAVVSEGLAIRSDVAGRGWRRAGGPKVSSRSWKAAPSRMLGATLPWKA